MGLYDMEEKGGRMKKKKKKKAYIYLTVWRIMGGGWIVGDDGVGCLLEMMRHCELLLGDDDTASEKAAEHGEMQIDD